MHSLQLHHFSGVIQPHLIGLQVPTHGTDSSSEFTSELLTSSAPPMWLSRSLPLQLSPVWRSKLLLQIRKSVPFLGLALFYYCLVDDNVSPLCSNVGIVLAKDSRFRFHFVRVNYVLVRNFCFAAVLISNFRCFYQIYYSLIN